MPPLKQRRLQIDRSRSKRRGSEDGKLSDFGFKQQKQQQEEEQELTSDGGSVRDDDDEEEDDDQRGSDENSLVEEDHSASAASEAEASKPPASNANRRRRSSTKAVKTQTTAAKRTKRNPSKKSTPSYEEQYDDADDFEPYFQESESDNDDDDEDFEQTRVRSKRATRTSSPTRRSTRASSGRMTQKSILETVFLQKPNERTQKKRASTTNTKTAARRSKQQTINFGPKRSVSRNEEDVTSESDVEIARKKPSPASSRSRSAKSATKGTSRKRIQKLEEDESSDEEEAGGQTDESSEEEIAVASRKKAGAKNRPRRAAAAKKPVVDLEESYDDDSAQEVITKPSRTAKAKQAARVPTVKRPSKQRRITVDSDDSDDNLDDVEEEVLPSRRAATRSSRRSARVASNSTGDIDDASADSNAESISRPSRVSAARAAKKLSQLSHEDDSDFDMAPKKKPGLNTEISSDEEFLDDDHPVDHHSTDSSDGSDENFEDADEFEVLSLIRNANDGQVKNVDDEEVGSMDESSNDRGDDDKTENELEVLPPQPHSADRKRSKITPPLEVVTYQRSKLSGDSEIQPRKHKDKGDESEFSDSDSEQSAGGEAKKQSRSNSRSIVRPKLPPCPSTHDTITAEPLPRRHVCFIPPDGKSRQCFALETLRKISLTCTSLVQSMSNGPVWLQPPHFRTELSDDMQDQIASRFGREALDIHGPFYNRVDDNLVARLRNGSSGRQEFDDEYDDGDDDDAFVPSNTLNDETFQDRLQKYMDNQMGGQDVYCCPLCYSEMHSRTANNSIAKQLKRQAQAARRDNGDDASGSEEDENKSDEDDEQRVEESIYDPMHVLQIVNDDYQVAGAVCNTKVANVKRHMREDHHVETKDVQGNDLYARFKIRTQDGLLQRWLKKKSRFGTFQGDMRKYWNEGNNQNFLLLLARIQEAEAHKQTLNVSNDEEERQIALDYLAPSISFFDSMQAKAKQNWKQISAPFQKARIDDMKDFIIQGDKDDESESADEVPHYALRRELDAQNAASSDDDDPLMRKLRKYTDAPQEYDDGGSEFSDEEANSNEGGSAGAPKYELSKEDLNPRGYYSEEEEETDEWVKKRLVSNKRQSRSNAANPTAAAGQSKKKVLRKRKLSITSAASGSTAQAPIVQVAPTPPSKRRQIVVDSDEE